MKKPMNWILSAAMLAVFSAACSTVDQDVPAADGEGMFQSDAAHNLAVKQAVQADIDRRIAEYVEPYEDIIPRYSGEMVKNLFVSIPEFPQWKKVFAMAQLPEYASADGKIRQKFVKDDNGKVQVQLTGVEIEKGYLDELGLIFAKPLSSVSSLDLSMVNFGAAAGAGDVPAEVVIGDSKCYPLVGTPKLGSGFQVFYVTTDDHKLKEVSLLSPEKNEIISVGGFDKFSIPTVINVAADGVSKMLIRQYSE